MKKTILLFAVIVFVMEAIVIFHADRTYPDEEIEQDLEFISSPADIKTKLDTINDIELCGETELEIDYIEDSRKLYNTIIADAKNMRELSLWRRGAIRTLFSDLIPYVKNDYFFNDREWVELGHYKMYKYVRKNANNHYNDVYYIIDWEEPVSDIEGYNYVWIFNSQSSNLHPIILAPSYTQYYLNCFLIPEGN